MERRPIGVTGATGGLGGRVARRLADHGVPQRVLVRDAARAPDLEHAEVATFGGYDDAPTVAPRGHVAILADDYDATVASVREAGFEFRPDDELWGVPRGFVRTPTGHRVEIMSGPPPP